MRTGKNLAGIVGAVAALTISSCTIAPPVAQTAAVSAAASADHDAMKAAYSALQAKGGKVFTLDPHASTVRIYAFRTGAAAALGHNHVIAAPQFAGFAYIPPKGLSGARFELEFRLDQLEIDNPEYRATLGAAFSSSLTPKDIDSTRKHMLGSENLQADRFPVVHVSSLEISGEAPKLAVRVNIELHGHAQEMWIPVNVEGLPERLGASASFVLRQSDFGITPYSALGGLLAVQDEIVIEFKLLGR